MRPRLLIAAAVIVIIALAATLIVISGKKEDKGGLPKYGQDALNWQDDKPLDTVIVSIDKQPTIRRSQYRRQLGKQFKSIPEEQLNTLNPDECISQVEENYRRQQQTGDPNITQPIEQPDPEQECKTVPSKLMQSTLDTMIPQSWLYLEGKRLNIEYNPGQERQFFQKLAKRYGITVATTTTESGYQRLYRSQRSFFQEPSGPAGWVIILPTKKEADKALQDLQQGTSWKEVMKRMSRKTMSEVGIPKQGFFLLQGGMASPAFKSILIGAQPAGPVKTQWGWAIGRKTFVKGRQKSYQEVKKQLRGLYRSGQEGTLQPKAFKKLTAYWRPKTICAPKWNSSLCGNRPKPSDQLEKVNEQQSLQRSR